MVQISTILAAALSTSSLLFVSASPIVVTGQDVALQGRAVGTIEWKGILEEGKPEVYLAGNSFEDIEEQAKALNPTYTIFDNSTAGDDAHLEARQTKIVQCGFPQGWGPALNTFAVWDGVAYLRGISGDCRAAPGPGWCTRVSCSWSSGIYYCNDNNSEHWEPCRWIGDVAAEIASQCSGGGTTYGQAFDHRNWNTIVARGDC